MKFTKIAVSLLLVICSLLSVGCSLSYFDITALDIIMPAQIDLFAGETTETIILRVTSAGDWDISDIRAVVADESIVRVQYAKDARERSAVRLEVKGLKEGITSFFFETTDGKVRSNIITVIVGPAYTSIKFYNSEDVVLHGINDNADVSFLVLRGNKPIECPDDLQIISENPEVAEIVYTGTVDGMETCAIVPISHGETYVYLQSSDGKIRTEKLKVLVIQNKGDDPIYFVLNIGTKKIHRHDCGSIKTVDSENKLGVWGSLDAYYEQGYTKCGNCFEVPKEEK